MITALALTPPQGGEWIIILVVVVLLFGAKKLPELGSSVGKSIRNFKSGIEEGKRGDDAASPTAGSTEPSASSTRTNE